jgi:uncharacterized protein (DUF2267 family)
MPAFWNLPGTVEPGELEGTSEWVPSGSGRGFLAALAPRLGSETNGAKLALAGLAPLRALLAPETWDAVAEELPFGLRTMLADAGAHLGPVPRLETRSAYLDFVARHAQHPPERTARYASALLGALRSALPAGLVDGVAAELPAELRALWDEAR